MALVLLVAIAIQLALPQQLLTYSKWVGPTIELILLAALMLANPGRIHHSSQVLRVGGLLLAALMTFGNIHQAARLVTSIIQGTDEYDAGMLLAAGAGVWITNVVVFALWYWELDRGGPAARAKGTRRYPDFLFAQMDTGARNYPPGWRPAFTDYFYVSFTNATAFSPTDTMPLSRWAKVAMMIQSAISLIVMSVVLARAVGLFT